MDPHESGGAPEFGRPDRPLGRGLEDVSHVFLSRKGGAEETVEPIADRRSERPLPRDKSAPSPLLLRPAACVTREQVAAAIEEFEGALETGLRGIDAGIPCAPHQDIDLLAIDRASQLTIIDFDTASSDDLLVRGLGHFDWVLRNVPNLRRMYRGQAINFSLEPRLVLLAPQISSRLRDVARQLTRPQISWVRYQFVEVPGRPGILFEPLTAD